jgi:uncharacterized GH25 family protein
MKKKITTCVVLLTVAILVQAHEFWLEPQKFFYAVGERALISFRVGENFMGEPWDLKVHRVEKLEVHHFSNVRDLKAAVKDGEKDNLEVALTQEGTYLIAMQSNDAYIELDADKFNDYLKEDGLDDALAIREKNNAMNTKSREFYSRYTKLLLQAGEARDDTYKKVVGFPIEIIPERNPYSLKKGDPIRFKILWQGKPLFGAKVKVWNRADNRTTVQNIYTEQNGMIETRISNDGSWMVSVVKMTPSKQEGADWQSYWGSLVFAVQK